MCNISNDVLAYALYFSVYRFYFHDRQSRSHSRGSLFAVGGIKNHPSSNSLDTPSSHPGSRRCSKPSILVEPDPEIYGKLHYIGLLHKDIVCEINHYL